MKKKDRFDGVSLVEIRALPSRMNEWMESAWRACTIKRERERRSREYNTKSKNQNTLISATWRRIARAANKTFSGVPHPPLYTYTGATFDDTCGTV